MEKRLRDMLSGLAKWQVKRPAHHGKTLRPEEAQGAAVASDMPYTGIKCSFNHLSAASVAFRQARWGKNAICVKSKTASC